MQFGGVTGFNWPKPAEASRFHWTWHQILIKRKRLHRIIRERGGGKEAVGKYLHLENGKYFSFIKILEWVEVMQASTIHSLDSVNPKLFSCATNKQRLEPGGTKWVQDIILSHPIKFSKTTRRNQEEENQEEENEYWISSLHIPLNFQYGFSIYTCRQCPDSANPQLFRRESYK